MTNFGDPSASHLCYQKHVARPIDVAQSNLIESGPSLHAEVVGSLLDEMENELPQLLRARHLHLGPLLVRLRVVVPRLHLHAPASCQEDEE